MAGHRATRGTGIRLADRQSRRREEYARRLAEARGPDARVAAAYEYLRGAVARTTRTNPDVAHVVADRATEALARLADELYATAIADRRTSR